LLSADGVVPARRAVHHAGGRTRSGSLMRHFLRRPPAHAVAVLARGVPAATVRAALIVGAGRPQRRSPGDRGTVPTAVPLPPVTVRAQEEDLRTLPAPAHHK